ncbi:MAG: hypothetical protein C4320_02790 [Armatimonadota bacterium]
MLRRGLPLSIVLGVGMIAIALAQRLYAARKEPSADDLAAALLTKLANLEAKLERFTRSEA